MKKMLLSFILCLALPIFSLQESMEYCDQESGFSLCLPQGFKHSWNMKNFDLGLEINVFLEKDCNIAQDEKYFSVVAQIPLNHSNGFDEIEFLSIVLKELEIGKEYIAQDGITLKVVEKPVIGIDNQHVKRMQIFLSFDENEEEKGFAADVQMFIENHYAFLVLIGAFPTDNFNELDELSHRMFQTIRLEK